jgi:hypothetical protein
MSCTDKSAQANDMMLTCLYKTPFVRMFRVVRKTIFFVAKHCDDVHAKKLIQQISSVCIPPSQEKFTGFAIPEPLRLLLKEYNIKLYCFFDALFAKYQKHPDASNDKKRFTKLFAQLFLDFTSNIREIFRNLTEIKNKYTNPRKRKLDQ